MRAATLAFLAGHRRARVEPLADRLVATIEASNPGYRATRLVPRADLWDSCHDNIRRVLELLAAAVDGARGPGEGSEATDTAYDAARATYLHGHPRLRLPADQPLVRVSPSAVAGNGGDRVGVVR